MATNTERRVITALDTSTLDIQISGQLMGFVVKLLHNNVIEHDDKYCLNWTSLQHDDGRGRQYGTTKKTCWILTNC